MKKAGHIYILNTVLALFAGLYPALAQMFPENGPQFSHGLRISMNDVRNGKGEVILRSERGIILIYSDSVRDLFFVRGSSSTRNYDQTEGEIWEISDTIVRKILDKQTYLIRTGYHKNTASEIFTCSHLLTPQRDKSLLVRNFKLDTLFKNRVIMDFVDIDSIVPVIYITDNQRYLLYGDRKVYLENYSKSWFLSPFPYIQYYRGGKTGAAIFTKNDYTIPKYSMTVLNPDFDSLEFNHLGLQVIKNDTMWQFREYQIREPFVYNRNFELAYKLKRNGHMKEIGSNGVYSRPDRGFSEFLRPNTPFLAGNFQQFDYSHPQKVDTGYFNSLNIELGIGHYESTSELEMWYGSWSYYGWGASLEYAFPLRPRAEILNHSGSRFQPLYVNLRAEGGAGFHFLFIPLGIQGQIGYTTNFRDHFIRPGIGFCLVNLQIGSDILIPLTNMNQGITAIQTIYVRIFAF